MVEEQYNIDGGNTGRGGFGDYLTANGNGKGGLKEAESEASRDRTCILCLKIIIVYLPTGWGEDGGEDN